MVNPKSENFSKTLLIKSNRLDQLKGCPSGGRLHIAEANRFDHGELEHTVNGETVLLTPGMIGVVRSGDEVVHRVPSEEKPAKVLIIWAPAGEIERIFGSATERPIEQ